MNARALSAKFPFAANGATIRSLRKRSGMSQERLAAAAGTTRRHMIRLENGEHLPGRDLRDRIATAVGRKPEEIQSSDDEEESHAVTNLDDLLRLRVRQILSEEVASAQ